MVQKPRPPTGRRQPGSQQARQIIEVAYFLVEMPTNQSVDIHTWSLSLRQDVAIKRQQKLLHSVRLYLDFNSWKMFFFSSSFFFSFLRTF
jgi:hypothetical protein